MMFHNNSQRLLWLHALVGLSLFSSIGHGKAPIYGLYHKDGIKDQYIVVMKDGYSNTRKEKLNKLILRIESLLGKRVKNRFSKMIHGFVTRANRYQLQSMAADESIAYIEQDRFLRLQASQADPPWGLDRVDARKGLDQYYEYSTTGRGVHAYIIDTGVASRHQEFNNKIGSGFTSINDNKGTEDCQGHGTHVAGTVGGKTYGIAKEVIIHPVRVLDCKGSGTTSGVISGVEWVAENAKLPAVANMSLGGGSSKALDDAVNSAIKKGVIFVVAAGNSNRDACNYSPARVPDAITVGATTANDRRASYSNYGTCVDLFAPGSNITSASIASDDASADLSGTSMASPHVAGVAALILQNNPRARPAAIFEQIILKATKGAISSIGSGSPNLLLYAGTNTDQPEPEPEPTPENPCSDCSSYSGNLSSTEDYDIQPDGSYFRGEGNFKAWLNGPRSADFDLYLEKYSFWFGWQTVAKSEGELSSEKIEYNGSLAYYRWKVYSASGNGNYNLFIK